MNARIGARDTVVHVGDFLCKGNERGAPGIKTRFYDLVDKLNGHWTFIAGNHDKNNGVRHACQSMIVKIGPKIAWVQHQPFGTDDSFPDVPFDLVICGHVHEKWRTCKVRGMIHINVGVDSNRYVPLRDDEVLGLTQKEERK